MYILYIYFIIIIINAIIIIIIIIIIIVIIIVIIIIKDKPTVQEIHFLNKDICLVELVQEWQILQVSFIK